VGEIHDPGPVKPVCGLLFIPDIPLKNIFDEMEAFLGPVEDQTPPFDFSFTAYYQKEMGSGLQKMFCRFRNLISPGFLVDIKIRTNAMEAAWSRDEKRQVNLDPGYISGAKLVLASTKNFSHRVYMGRGIWGDVQLRYVHGRFAASEWTYPDYTTDRALRFFEETRKTYLRQEALYDQTHSV